MIITSSPATFTTRRTVTFTIPSGSYISGELDISRGSSSDPTSGPAYSRVNELEQYDIIFPTAPTGFYFSPISSGYWHSHYTLTSAQLIDVNNAAGTTLSIVVQFDSNSTAISVDNFKLTLTPTPIPSVTPPIITATGGMGATGITLNWSSPDAENYKVYKHDESTETWTLLYSGSLTTFFDVAVSQNVFYFYYAIAIDSSDNESDASNLASAKITEAGIFSMLTSRATIYQGIKLGFETTPGTLVPATKTILNMELTQAPQIPNKSIRGSGAKGVVGTQKGQVHTESRYTAALDYNLLPYLMRMGYGAVTPVVDSNTNKMVSWHWNPSATDPLTPDTATIEQGSVKGAEKFGFGVLSDSSISWSKEDAGMEGTIFGQKQVRDATMTPSIRISTGAAIATATSLSVTTPGVSSGTIPSGTYVTNLGNVFVVTGGNTITAGAATLTVTALANPITSGEIAYSVSELPVVPVDPNSVSVYVSLDGVNWTQLLDTLEGSIKLNGLWKPSFHVNDANSSFDRVVETSPTFGASLTFEEGTEADNFMSHLENGTRIYFGVKSVGPTINSSPLTKHLIRLNIPMFVMQPDQGDKGDVHGNTYTMEHAHDIVFGLFDLTVQNKLQSL